jgi:hypothetical protein
MLKKLWNNEDFLLAMALMSYPATGRTVPLDLIRTQRSRLMA